MTTIALPVQPTPVPSTLSKHPVIAFAGNPNAGKTSLFNALTGLRAKTANFPGTTVEHRVGHCRLGDTSVQLIDLPGLYGLNAVTPEETIAQDALLGRVPRIRKPDVVLIVLDATNLERNLYLASQVLQLGLPTIAALNMVDLARNAGIVIDAAQLAKDLGCPVIAVSARTREGVDELRAALRPMVTSAVPQTTPEALTDACNCSGCPHAARYNWAESTGGRCTDRSPLFSATVTEKIDRAVTHPLLGIVALLGVMLSMFLLIFWIAQYPMEWIDVWFGFARGYVERIIPAGDFQSLVSKGIIGGVGGMLVFLPQICILFFVIALLEDSGYMARAAFVMDRLMARVGLPGKAFLPMLAAHACAIPGIMATRVIEDKRDRLVTILVLPLMTCSARLPVYVMVTALLFPYAPLKAALLFTGAYLLGIVAALAMALLFKRTILPGSARPLVLELPSYKMPSFRDAFLTAVDRARLFIWKAGTVILLISVILWAAATYPKSDAPAQAVALHAQADVLLASGDEDAAQELTVQANRLISRSSLENSLAGRAGKLIEPVIRPLGFDWQIGVGVISSFAAREVIVSTLSIVYGLGEDGAEDNVESLYDTMRQATHPSGAPVFTFATCVSLLVFYVLAMQCLPTQAVTRRETNSWKWPAFQLAYMTVLAYVGALVAYQLLSAAGLG